MRKTIILTLLFMVLLIGFVKADIVTEMNDNVFAYYKLENTDDSKNSYDLTTGYAESGATGIIDNAYSFNGTGEYIQHLNNISEDFKTFSFWVKFDNPTCTLGFSLADKDMVWIGGFSGDLADEQITVVSSWDVGGRKASFISTSQVSLNTGTWYHIVLVWDAGNSRYDIYVDGSKYTTTAHAQGHAELLQNQLIQLGVGYNGGAYYDGLIDEVSFYNVSLNSTHVDFLYNSGSPISDQQYPFSEPLGNVPPSFTTYYESPKNNTINNSNLIINYNITDETSTTINCNLFINDTINNTQNAVAINTTLTFNISLGSDGDYTYFINCTNTTNESKTSSYTYTYDTTEPPIYINFPLSDNSTTFNYTNRSLILDIYTTDQHLYHTNLTIFNATGSQMYNNYSGNISGQNRYNWTDNINMSSWNVGHYDIFIEATDSHTKKYWDGVNNYNLDNDNKQLSFFMDDGNEVEITLIDSNKLEEFDRVETTKTIDRYSFEFYLKDELPKNTYFVFSLKTIEKLEYLSDSEFIGHFISGMNWIDFEGVNGDIEIFKISDYEYNIKITLLNKTDSLIFNSIGGLNYNSKWVSFEVLENLTIYANDTNTGLLIENFSVTYDGNIYTATGNNTIINVVANTTHNIQVNKAGYGTGSTNIFVGFGPQETTVNMSSSGITLNIYDEITQSIITTETVTIEVIGNTSNEYSTAIGVKTISGLSAGDYEIRLTAPSYHPSSYYATFTGSGVESVNLYMLNSSTFVSSRVIHTLLDQDSNILQNYTVKLQRYFVTNGTYLTIRMSKTNFEGQTVLYVEPYDVYYKLEYENENGNVVEITDPSPFFSTETTDIINIDSPIYTSWRTHDNVLYNLSFVNLTGTIYARFIYSDTNNIVRAGCLRVDRISGTDFENICYNCTNAAGATLTCVINTSQEGQWKAAGLIDTNTTGSWYSVLTEFYKGPGVIAFGETGVFYSLIMVGTVAMMGIASVTGSIILMLVALIGVAVLSFIQGLNVGILTYLIVLGFIIIFVVRKSKE